MINFFYYKTQLNFLNIAGTREQKHFDKVSTVHYKRVIVELNGDSNYAI